MSGAVDVMVVRQPDGSFKSSPFYGAQLHHFLKVAPLPAGCRLLCTLTL